jgi:glycosyltransferase involved in cell wall biosynthesis
VSTPPLPSTKAANGSGHATPSFSVVVPVHNEAPIVDAAVRRMLAGLETLGGEFEMVVCENGSTDRTASFVERLQHEDDRVRLERLPEPDYGGALRHGIRVCRHDRVIIFNIDFWSIAFTREALEQLERCDLVVGSKVMTGAGDHRPAFRRLITRAFNSVLRVFFGFAGTDTHGIKAFNRDALAEVLAGCVTSRSIFDTELVLRAERSGLRIVEVPVEVREIRQPSYWAVVRRLPEVTWNLLKLAVAIRRSR